MKDNHKIYTDEDVFDSLNCQFCGNPEKHKLLEKWTRCEEIFYHWKCCKCGRSRLQIIE